MIARSLFILQSIYCAPQIGSKKTHILLLFRLFSFIAVPHCKREVWELSLPPRKKSPPLEKTFRSNQLHFGRYPRKPLLYCDILASYVAYIHDYMFSHTECISLYKFMWERKCYCCHLYQLLWFVRDCVCVFVCVCVVCCVFVCVRER